MLIWRVRKIREKLHDPAAGRILTDPALAPDRKLELLLMQLLEKPELPEVAAFAVPTARFQCNCSEQKMRETARRMLGEEELAKLRAENPDPTITCRFCRRIYHL